MWIIILIVVSAIIAIIALTIMFVHLYINHPIRPKSKVCLVGKTAIVTGANRGIGYETALALAQRGCRVIIACRSNLEQTRDQIIKETDNPNILAKHLDLSSFDSVKTFAEYVNQNEERLDILIHNAVLVAIPLYYTPDGLNPVMQINHFSPFLLTHLLMDLLKKSAPSRVIFVSSILAYLNNLSLENLNYPEKTQNTITFFTLYDNCKCCNIFSVVGFSKKIKNSGVTFNAIHPGMVNTSFFRQLKNAGTRKFLITLLFWLIVRPFSKTAEEGSYAIITTAISHKYKDVTGKFLYDRGEFPLPYKLRNEEFVHKIWEATERYIKLNEG